MLYEASARCHPHPSSRQATGTGGPSCFRFGGTCPARQLRFIQPSLGLEAGLAGEGGEGGYIRGGPPHVRLRCITWLSPSPGHLVMSPCAQPRQHLCVLAPTYHRGNRGHVFMLAHALVESASIPYEMGPRLLSLNFLLFLEIFRASIDDISKIPAPGFK